MAFDEALARKIIDAELGREGPLLPILHALLREFGCIPSEAEPLIATMLNITRAEVHGVVSFYHDFRRAPAGRHVLQLCRAEACQSMGAEGASRRLLEALGLDWGGTTADEMCIRDSNSISFRSIPMALATSSIGSISVLCAISMSLGNPIFSSLE